MSHILYLLKEWQAYSLVFYLLSFLLGLWMAYLIWYAYARRARRARLRQQALNDRALRLRRQIDELGGGGSMSGSVPDASASVSGSLELSKDTDAKSGGIGVPEDALGGAATLGAAAVGKSIGQLEGATDLDLDAPDVSGSVSVPGGSSGPVEFGVKAPSVPGSNVDFPDMDMPDVPDLPDVGGGLPEFKPPEISAPDIDVPETGSFGFGTPEVDLPKTDLPDVEAPSIELPDVNAPKLDLPEIDPPDVDTPAVDLPKIDLPDVDAPESGFGISAPEFNAPSADLPDLDLPDVSVPDVSVPEISVPEISVPDLDVAASGFDAPSQPAFGISVPDVDGPNIDLPDVDGPNIDLPDVDGPNIDLPDVDGPKIGLPDVDVPKISLPDVDGPSIDHIDLPDVDLDGGNIDPRVGVDAGDAKGPEGFEGSDYKPEISSPDLDGGPDVIRGAGAGISTESGPESGPDGGASGGNAGGGWFPRSDSGEDGPGSFGTSGSGTPGPGTSGLGTSGGGVRTSSGVAAGGSSGSAGGPSASVAGGSGGSDGVKGLGATTAAGIGALGAGAGIAAGHGGDTGVSGSVGPALRKDFEGEDVSYNDDLGALYGSRPGTVDDLKLIKGIGPKLEGDLNAAGVYRFKQLAHWSPKNVEQFADKLGTFKDRIERDRWIEQARDLAVETAAEEAESYTAPATVDHQSALSSQFFGEDVRIDPSLGILYNRDPDLDDDLQQISGIGPGLEGKLQENGVYRFKQIANWSDDNVTAFADKLDTFKDRIERDKWILQAKRLHRGTYRANSRWGSPRPSRMEMDELARQEFAGESTTIDDEMGILYQGQPKTVDDLKQITGIGKVMERRLHRLGIYRFKQIANWSESQVQAVSRSLGTNADYVYHDEWIGEAARLAGDSSPAPTPAPSSGGSPLSGGIPFAGGGAARDQFSGEDVRVDPRLGILYEKPPSTLDDLCKIKGIGPVLQERLNQFGVYRFKQVANWTPAHVEAFAEGLDTFKDRITRDEWIAQAKELAK